MRCLSAPFRLFGPIISVMSEHVLSSIFLGHVAASQRESLLLGTAAEQALTEAWDAGRTAWPDVALPAPLFIQHLAERCDPVASEEELAAALKQLQVSDLYLACACLHQVAGALQHFDREFIGRVPTFVARLRLQPSFIQDVQQELCKRLLVEGGEAPPRIAAYRGRGQLANWLKAVAVRTAISLGRKKDEQVERLPDLAEYIPEVANDPALEAMRRRYGVEFKAALEASIAALTGEQRNLLRHYYVKGFTTGQIGALFNMNQSSASRKLSAIRENLLAETRRRLRESLKLGDSDFNELAGLIQSQLNLSLSRLLRDSTEPAPGSEAKLPSSARE